MVRLYPISVVIHFIAIAVGNFHLAIFVNRSLNNPTIAVESRYGSQLLGALVIYYFLNFVAISIVSRSQEDIPSAALILFSFLDATGGSGAIDLVLYRFSYRKGPALWEFRRVL